MAIENVRTKRAHDPDSRYTGALSDPEENPNDENHPLDSDESVNELHKVQNWYAQERERQSDNRAEMSIDEDFYDGLQWREEDIQVLVNRGQAPLVFNITAQMVNWLLGTEKRTRVDFNVLPREEDDVQDAQTKTKVLKYLSDVNKSPFYRSAAFKDAIVAGVGWLEDGIRSDPTEELLFTRNESWRNCWHDSLGLEPSMRDGRYFFRGKWVDLDIAEAMLPERRAQLRKAATSQTAWFTDDDATYFNPAYYNDNNKIVDHRVFLDDVQNLGQKRERVRLIEGWYKKPVETAVVIGNELGNGHRFSVFDGLEFDESSRAMINAYNRGYISVNEGVHMRMHCMIWAGSYLLQLMKSPYRHNRFPFTPVWCYRRGRDNLPYGVIRNARDPQEDLNKRASKALFILSTKRVIADEDAVEDWDDTEDELARPDPVIKKRPGKDFLIETDNDIAQGHLTLMDVDRQFIHDAVGVQGENIGEDTNAISGKAILAKQQEGSVVTQTLFDNFRLAMQLQGEKQLSLIEQYYSERKVVRLTGDRNKLDFTVINDIPKPPEEMEEGEEEQYQVDEDGEPKLINDITSSIADFVVDAQDFRESMRVAFFETMMQTISKLPGELAIKVLDLAFELSDLPGKDEIVRRIREVNGMTDPDEELSPEERAKREQREREQEEDAKLQRDAMMADLKKKLADADKNKADAMAKRLDTIIKALESGNELIILPGAADAADSLLEDAGFEQADETLE